MKDQGSIHSVHLNQLVVDKFAEYDDLFGEDVEKMVKVASVVKENFLRRKKILKQRTLSSNEEPSEPI